MIALLRYSTLILMVWNIPSYALFYMSPSMGNIFSLMTFGLLIAFFVFSKNKKKPLLPFLILGILYFSISGLNYTDFEPIKYYFFDFIKLLIVIIIGAEVARVTKLEELYIIFMLGAFSIIIHAIFFPNIDVIYGENYGRFSGFYLNPNLAGTISLIGFSLSYGISNKKLKILGQLIFSLAGIFTLSRTFILIWVLIILYSAIRERKNLWAPILGAGVIILILSVGGLKLNKDRFSALQSIFSDDKIQSKTITNDSRTGTWANFYDVILDHPFIGNGYGKLQGGYFGQAVGVHNTYLMVLGESGVIPFLILIWIILYLLIKSFKYRKQYLYYFLVAISISTYLLVSHTYFRQYSILFMSMFLYIKLINLSNTNEEYEIY